jgi:hypothetical protein
MTIRFYCNNAPAAPRWKAARLPINQTLLWIGPFFILIQRKEVK